MSGESFASFPHNGVRERDRKLMSAYSRHNIITRSIQQIIPLVHLVVHDANPREGFENFSHSRGSFECMRVFSEFAFEQIFILARWKHIQLPMLNKKSGPDLQVLGNVRLGKNVSPSGSLRENGWGGPRDERDAAKFISQEWFCLSCAASQCIRMQSHPRCKFRPLSLASKIELISRSMNEVRALPSVRTKRERAPLSPLLFDPRD